MYVVVEAWTPNQEFLSLPAAAREEIFDGVREGISKLAEAGIQSLGWGHLDEVAHGSAHQWLAVWTMPSAEHSEIFLGAVAASGWYAWFEQTNLRAELIEPEDAMAAHLKLS
jgi:hypothetical protein